MSVTVQLLEIFRGLPDYGDASLGCEADPDAFFPVRNVGETEAELTERIADLKRICQGCHVQLQCLRDAEARGEKWGIWGGVDFEQSKRGRKAEQRRVLRQAAGAASS